MNDPKNSKGPIGKSALKNSEALKCGVLVIGGGGAGLRAAVAAKMAGADVLLASKAGIGRNCNTYISKAIVASAGWGASEDDETEHAKDTLRGGCFLNDRSLVARMTRRARAEIAFLKDCGVRFGMRGDALRVIKVPGHSHPRHVHGENWTGSDLVLPLKRFAEKIGVRFAERVFITRLAGNEGRICGAAGVSSAGVFLEIHASAVILATGGYAQIYANTNNAPGITGDGQALAFHAGADLKDMEFVQFYPTAMGRTASRLLLYESLLTQPGVNLRNRRGENVLERNAISDPSEITRDRMAQIVTAEIEQSDSPDGGVLMDTQGLSPEAAKKLSSVLPSKWWQGKKAYPVAPTAHFCMGGIAVDENGETRAKGLFAVGEAAAGVHGANRLGGNALAEIFAMGSWVGEWAAERAKKSAPPAPASMFDEEKNRLESLFSEQGASVKESMNTLKRLMQEKAGVIRRGPALADAVNRLRQPLPQIAITNPARLFRYLEFQNMRLVSELVCLAALERAESRGAHFREDYPHEDNRQWSKNIVLNKSETGTRMRFEPASTD